VSGYLFALISSVFFSLYVVPRKLSKLSPVVFSFFMAVGFSVCSLVLYLFKPLLGFQESFSPILWWSVLAGLIWAGSFVLFVGSIDLIGLSRSNQWKNLQGPVGAVLSLVVLKEFATTNPVFALLAAVAIFLSAIFFTTSSETAKKINIRGVSLALLSALGFGSVAVIQKYVTSHVGVYLQQVVWSLAIAGSIATYILLRGKISELRRAVKREVWVGLSAGVLYLGASLFQLFSYQHLAASIAFTMIQTSALWTIAIGILVFKEIDLKKHYGKVSLGLILAIIGIILLVFARK